MRDEPDAFRTSLVAARPETRCAATVTGMSEIKVGVVGAGGTDGRRGVRRRRARS